MEKWRQDEKKSRRLSYCAYYPHFVVVVDRCITHGEKIVEYLNVNERLRISRFEHTNFLRTIDLIVFLLARHFLFPYFYTNNNKITNAWRIAEQKGASNALEQNKKCGKNVGLWWWDIFNKAIQLFRVSIDVFVYSIVFIFSCLDVQLKC